jgi:chemotaxis protein methyltransferase CheR
LTDRLPCGAEAGDSMRLRLGPSGEPGETDSHSSSGDHGTHAVPVIPASCPQGVVSSQWGHTSFSLCPLEQVNDAQQARYSRLIYERTGIRMSPQKKMLLSNRLRRRLRDTGIRNFEAYYRYLRSIEDNDSEWDKLFQEITTHETYLFRDENQWDWFSRVFLKDHTSRLRASGRERRLRIWSAACSTGDEVYTIACCIAAHLPNPRAWQLDILGTDLAVGEIERAKKGVFGARAMRLVPPEYIQFFDKDEESETWSARPILREMIRFDRHNLMEPLRGPAFDLVFLKNVLIYFDKESKRKTLENVGPMVKPGGFMVAGAAEGVTNLTTQFKRIEPWLYTRITR